MKKNLVSFILMFAMMFSLAIMPSKANAVEGGTHGDNITWELSGGTLTISGSGYMEETFYQSFPWRKLRNNIKSIVIKNGITSIADGAFHEFWYLESVDIPSSVKSIGASAFTLCKKLEDVNINYGVEKIGSSAFFRCESLSEIELPETVTSIGGDAFQYCVNITEISIPNGVKRLENGTFLGCSCLESITIPESVTVINSIFYDCSNLRDIYYEGSEDDWNKIDNYYIKGKNYIDFDYDQVTVHFAESSEYKPTPSTPDDTCYHTGGTYKETNYRECEQGGETIHIVNTYGNEYCSDCDALLRSDVAVSSAQEYHSFIYTGIGNKCTTCGYEKYEEKQEEEYNGLYQFDDVPKGSYGYEAIYKLADLKIVDGWDGKYNPGGYFRRAEAAAILCRLFKETNYENVFITTEFDDVTADHWASAYIKKMTDKGILHGFGDGSFRPDDDVTGYQLLTMLVNAMGYENKAISYGGYPYGHYNVANELGLLKGVEYTNWEMPVKRSTVAIIVANAIKLSPFNNWF